ncbi:MAG: hypothetical protein OET18_05290 [Desulfobacterales bacterium]|nr:hypothetical protein [Desulfobacterales bacterium]
MQPSINKKLLLISFILFSVVLNAQQEMVKVDYEVYKKERSYKQRSRWDKRSFNKAVDLHKRLIKVGVNRRVKRFAVYIEADDIDKKYRWCFIQVKAIKRRDYKHIKNPPRFGFGYNYKYLKKREIKE